MVVDKIVVDVENKGKGGKEIKKNLRVHLLKLNK
jgi:hypothetical protein